MIQDDADAGIQPTRMHRAILLAYPRARRQHRAHEVYSMLADGQASGASSLQRTLDALDLLWHGLLTRIDAASGGLSHPARQKVATDRNGRQQQPAA